VDIRNLPALCGDHIRRLGQIYRSNLPEPDKERAFEVGLRDAADCVSCKTRRYSATSGPLRMKVKICVVGDKSAEKAAILSPFVQPNFDDRYIQTLGTQVSKKELVLLNPASGEIHVDMTVWNILGHRGFRELLKEAYFYAARGVLCVCDGTRSDGLGGIDDWVPSIFDVTGRIPVTILVNTKGEPAKQVIEEAAVAAKAKAYDASYFFTSTKTHENVERALHMLAEGVVANRFRQTGDGQG